MKVKFLRGVDVDSYVSKCMRYFERYTERWGTMDIEGKL